MISISPLPPLHGGRCRRQRGAPVPTHRVAISGQVGLPLCHSVTSPPAKRGERGSDSFRGFRTPLASAAQPIDSGAHRVDPSARLLGLHRVLERVAVLVPRGVIVRRLVPAEQSQQEVSVRRTDAALSIRRDALVRRDPQLAEHLPQHRGRLQRPHRRLQRVQPLQMHRPRDAPAALRAALVRARPFAV